MPEPAPDRELGFPERTYPDEGGGPPLSVVLFTRGRYESIRKTIQYLREQTAREQLEIVIVAPSAEGLGLIESDRSGFRAFRVVEIGPFKSGARARAAGIRQATAPVVVLGEDHSYPDSGWAKALIEAHRQPWAAVGPEVLNGNPGSMLSWAQFFVSLRPLVPAGAGRGH